MNNYLKRKHGSTDDAAPRCSMRVDRASAGEVLLACLGSGAGEDAWLGQMSDVDWDEVIRESARQGITPLFYKRLRAADPGAVVPARVTGLLREFSIGSALKSLRLYHELSEILDALRSEEIPVIVLKGAYLAECVYGDKALRPMRDLDLMVRRCDLSRAEAKLVEMGYRQRPEPYAEWDYSASAHLHPLTKPGGVVIEIHWTIESPTEPFAIDVEGLVGAAVPAEALAGLEPSGLEPRLIALARAEILGQTTTVPVSARFAQMWGSSRILEKASLLVKTVFPMKKSLGRMYPACRGPRWLYLYYPVRWRDLLRQYGPSAWQMARRDENVTALVRREHERAILMNWLKSASL